MKEKEKEQLFKNNLILCQKSTERRDELMSQKEKAEARAYAEDLDIILGGSLLALEAGEVSGPPEALAQYH